MKNIVESILDSWTWPEGATAVERIIAMSKKEGLNLWTYPEWIKYLRAIIRRLTPTPRRTVQKVLDAVAPVLESQQPVILAHLIATPPSRTGVALAACHLANGICLIATYWAGYDGANTRIPLRSSDACWGKAHTAAKEAERWAVPFWQCGVLDLMECAIEAMSGVTTDLHHKDAAHAAAQAGHYQLAHDILTYQQIDVLELYELCERGCEQKAVELALIHLEHSLRKAQWRSVDDVLTRLDVSRLTPAVVVAILSVTVPAKTFLKTRSAFLERTEDFLSKSLGQERAGALLMTRR